MIVGSMICCAHGWVGLSISRTRWRSWRAAPIRECGFTNPILTDGDRGITAGQGRLLAARKLRMPKRLSSSGRTPSRRRSRPTSSLRTTSPYPLVGITIYSGWNSGHCGRMGLICRSQASISARSTPCSRYPLAACLASMTFPRFPVIQSAPRTISSFSVGTT